VKSDEDEFGPITPGNMVEWLRQEIRDISKATELRLQDATDFVTAFATGKISEEQLSNRLSIYHDRWGEEPIPGVRTDDKMTNEDIIQRLDNALPKSVRETIKKKLGTTSGQGHRR